MGAVSGRGSATLPRVPAVFVLPAGDTFTQLTTTFQQNTLEMPLPELRSSVTAMAEAYIDSAVHGLVLGLITDGVSVSSFTESLMRGVASVVESVSRKLVAQILKKAERSVLLNSGHFYVSRVETLPTVAHTVIAVPLSPENEDAIDLAIQTVEREHLVRAMHGIVDDSLVYLFDAAFEVIPLGAMMRKGVTMGASAMRSGAKSASGRAIRGGSDEEVKELAAFLTRRRQPAAYAQ